MTTSSRPVDSHDALLAAIFDNHDLDIADIDEDMLVACVDAHGEGSTAVDLLSWLLARSSADVALRALVRLIEQTRDPVALAEMIDMLATGQHLGETAARAIWTACVKRAEDRKSRYGVRSYALHGGLLLSQQRPALLRRFQGMLLDVGSDDDPLFLRHVAKIVGAVLAHDINEVFRRKLDELLNVPEAEDEAAMELGLDALRSGLDAESSETAVSSFQNASTWFARASATSEKRGDAELFHKCCVLLLMVHAQGFDGSLVTHIKELEDAAVEYAAHLAPSQNAMSNPSWLGSSTTEQTHWVLLGFRLSALDASLQRKLWLNVGAVLEKELFAIYQCSRSIFLRNKDGAIEQILRPKISRALGIHRRHLEEIEQWIDENADSDNLPDAKAMRDAASLAYEGSILHFSDDAACYDRELAAILDAGRLPDASRSALHERFKTLAWMLELEENPIFERIGSAIRSELKAKNNDYRTLRKAQVLFDAILYCSLNFLQLRHNMTRKNDAAASYLFIRRPLKLPKEEDLHADYYRYLTSTLLGGSTKIEVSDVASGRADVYFDHKKLITVTEVKMSDDDLSHAELLDRFGGQTAAYLTTTVNFGFLLVLDRYDRDGSQPHFSEQISLERKVIKGQSTPYDIVTMRVQAQRTTPASQ
ncbi:hypothetical protein [Paraburkholderia hospita]|uniref:hypothetical protein n=1 Tax=Paraburkholderia hospita TaxID=169430 RepID=UPI0009A576C8|nr:hypothetical protein [Paraburkholderia hospita]SKC93419.1 hypothetical protein SAMN05446934_6578 [Paraburkholderia hospita]